MPLSLILLLTLACRPPEERVEPSLEGGTGTPPDGGADGGSDSGTDGGTDGGGSTTGDGGTDTGGDGGTPKPDPPPNILLVVSDDIGVDASACYDLPKSTRAPQPSVEALCARGLVFESAWAQPLCSPTRASLLTGRYPYRHGVVEALSDSSDGLSLDERLIPAVLDAAGSGYAHAVFGKWHLGTNKNGGFDHPNLAGFSHFVGAWGGGVSSYTSWERIEDGVTSTAEGYITSQTVDDALGWIEVQEQPWFALVAFHAAHMPLHLPPEDLHTQDLSGEAGDVAENAPAYFRAMVEAMDTELGRLFASLPPDQLENTVIIYTSDNGTVSALNSGAWPDGHGKSTLYLGGVLVPLVIAGPVVAEPGRLVGGRVDVVDLFPTILELAGVSPEDWLDAKRPIDGESLVPSLSDPAVLPTRVHQLAEWFPNASWPGAGRTLSDGRFKLIRTLDGGEHLYDLEADPLEATPLDLLALDAEAAAARESLNAALALLPVPSSGG